MRKPQVEMRSRRDVAVQYVSDFEIEPKETRAMSESAAVERDEGVVKFFNPEKGYGFCKREKGADVFVHVNELKRSGIDEPVKEGDRLSFEMHPVDGKGPKARAITILSRAGNASAS